MSFVPLPKSKKVVVALPPEKSSIVGAEKSPGVRPVIIGTAEAAPARLIAAIPSKMANGIDLSLSISATPAA